MTIFEKIIAREIPSKIIFENQNLIVIEDINPKRATHWLVITKTAYNKIQDIPLDESYIMQDILAVVQNLSIQYHFSDNYQIIINNGSKAGQEVPHLHVHLLSSKQTYPTYVT